LQGATASTRRAMRLNPRSPSITWSSLAFVHAAVGDRQRAAELLERVRSANPEILLAVAYLAFYRERQGNHAEAARLVTELQAVNPDLTAEMTLHWLGPLEDPDHMVAMLRRAGLP
ncbi:MAG: hypothetical protein ABFS41_08905, partial [Myxococcota bacterium]